MQIPTALVALLTEGVDRNFYITQVTNADWTSPSSRRAWIEMRHFNQTKSYGMVALLTEGVDRNSLVEMSSCK